MRTATFAMYNSLLVAALLGGCGQGSPTRPAAVPEVYSIRVEPASLALRAGDEAQLAAQAQDAQGDIAGGAMFSFSSLDPQIAQVNATGRVRATGSAGSTQLRVASGGRAVLVTVVVAAGTAARTEVLALPDTQAVAGGSLGKIRVRVVDEYGNGLGNVPVAWQITQGGGTLADAAAHTGNDGSAAVKWTAGAMTGAQTLEFTSSGVPPRVFTAMAQAGPAHRLELQLVDDAGGEVEDLVAGQPARLVASVMDANGNPVAGIGVLLERAADCGFDGGRAATGDAGSTEPISWVPGEGRHCRILGRVEGTGLSMALNVPILAVRNPAASGS